MILSTMIISHIEHKSKEKFDMFKIKAKSINDIMKIANGVTIYKFTFIK